PFPAPAEEQVARDICLVSDRPVRVTRWIRRFAESVCLDAVADLAVLIRRPASFPVVLDRKVAVGSLSLQDSLCADDAGVADVDHIRVLDVEANPKAGEEYGGGGENPNRPDRPRLSAPAAAGPDAPDHAAEQIDERRIDERHAREDLALVEEPERDAERDECEQVEVAKRE